MSNNHDHRPSTISLIGMPGAGKSTVGVLLAKALGFDFVDTDLLIQSTEAATLQQIINREGYLALRAIEERVILAHRFSNTVISTGGSVVYSKAAMLHIKSTGPAMFLDVPFQEIHSRVNNLDDRGIARSESQTLEDVFHERQPLYKIYADITVPASGGTIEDTVAAVIDALAAVGSSD